MEELQAKHRKEAKDLQSRITQKKKQATKKTRKGVNDECDALERELKERQAAELAALNGEGAPTEESKARDDDDDDDEGKEQDMSSAMDSLALNGDSPHTTKQQSQQPNQPTTEPPQTDSNSPPTPTNNTKKPNRARARLARRAAEQASLSAQAAAEAAALPDAKAVERSRMLAEFTKRKLREKEIRADGHCLYSAVADQMGVLGLPLGSAPGEAAEIGFREKKEEEEGKGGVEAYRLVRRAAADFIAEHPDDFAPFLEEPVRVYTQKVRDTGEWGGQPELLALAKTYGIKISVLQGDGSVEEFFPEDGEGDEQKSIWLAYYRHGFGLGEHYNSLRKSD